MVYANVTTDEDSSGLYGEKTIVFPWPPKQLTIVNDGPLADLQWKFKEGHDWATLKPRETIAFPCSVTQLILSSAGAKYRVWGIG